MATVLHWRVPSRRQTQPLPHTACGLTLAREVGGPILPVAASSAGVTCKRCLNVPLAYGGPLSKADLLEIEEAKKGR